MVALASLLLALPQDGLADVKLPKVDLAPPGVRLVVEGVRREDDRLPPGTMDFKLRITNGSARDIVLFQAGFWPNHAVRLKERGGHELPLTKYGTELRRGLVKSFRIRDHNASLTLKTGETYEYGMRLDFRKLYEAPPGRYTLAVEYLEQTSYPMRIVANELPIKIPAPPEDAIP